MLIEKHEASLYKFISHLLLNEYGKTLTILEIPMFPYLPETDTDSSSIETNKISPDATRDQMHGQFSKLKFMWKVRIRNYFKANGCPRKNGPDSILLIFLLIFVSSNFTKFSKDSS